MAIPDDLLNSGRPDLELDYVKVLRIFYFIWTWVHHFIDHVYKLG